MRHGQWLISNLYPYINSEFEKVGSLRSAIGLLEAGDVTGGRAGDLAALASSAATQEGRAWLLSAPRSSARLRAGITLNLAYNISYA